MMTATGQTAISLKQAVRQGLAKLYLARWADPGDHIELQLLPDGAYGPWVSLWSDGNAICGNPNPYKLICTSFDWDEEEWLPWEPPEGKIDEDRRTAL